LISIIERRSGGFLAVVVASLWLAGCATKMDAGEASRIKSITIATIAEPDFFYRGRDTNLDLNPAMRTQNLHLGAELAQGIANSLRSEGYNVSVASDPKQADAVMEVSLGGLLPDQLGPIYAGRLGGPVFTAKVRLYDSTTHKTLFSQLYEVADPPIKPMDGTVLIVPDPKYVLGSGTDAPANPGLVAEGFRSAIQPVAASIAHSLRKPS